MGLFSTRRGDDVQQSVQDEVSVVRILRSRLHGKSKGKEREVEPTPSLTPYTSPSLAASNASFANRGADLRSVAGSIRGPRTSSSTTRNWTGSSTASPKRNGLDPVHSRTSTDVITVTLAQRLNELATANSEGLLSDDEYRLLRQNLFERFASGSAVPTEAPLVPMSKTAHAAADSRNNASNGRRASSNFHVQPNSVRSPSISSKKSFSSTVTGLLRRATSRRIVSLPAEQNSSDAMSIYSMASTPGERVTLPRGLAKQNSDMSLRTSTSASRLSQTFGRRTVIGNHTFSATDPGISSHSTHPRTRSNSRSKPPPSSFHGASKGAEPTYTHISMNEIPDDDQVESLQDIRHQIELVEAEGRRLLDAFNGLELSTLTRRQRKPPVIPPLPSVGSFNDGNWPSGTRPGKDTDALSFKSSTSARTARSLKRAASSKMRVPISPQTTLSAQQPSVIRKGSMSSVSSRGKSGPSLLLTGQHGLASSSSVNLARSVSHLPLETVEETESRTVKHSKARGASSRRDSRWAETSGGSMTHPTTPSARSEVGSISSGKRGGAGQIDDEELMTLETELADIRRRRGEVTARYEARLEYLRARLKGAELREKILRK